MNTIRACSASILLGAVAMTAATADAGNFVAWGRNVNGETTIPNVDVIDVAASSFAGAAIKTDGTLVSWGHDGWGQVSTTPTGTFSRVYGGNTYTMGIRTDGTLTTWGAQTPGDSPTAMVTTSPSGQFLSASGGLFHAVGLRTDGTLAAWGLAHIHTQYGTLNAPSGTFVSVAAGGYHGAALRADGSVAMWGLNQFGIQNVPSGTFTKLGAGGYFTLGLRSDGTIAGWGKDDYGVLSTIPSGTFSDFVVGAQFAFARRTSGEWVSWGRNNYGQLDLPSADFSKISAGGYFAVGIPVPSPAVGFLAGMGGVLAMQRRRGSAWRGK